MKKVLLLCTALLTLAANAKAQSNISTIVSDMRTDVNKSWKFEIQCKVTNISDEYRVGERRYYVITVKVVDTTYNEQLGILYGKDYRGREVEMQIVSFVSSRECNGTRIKRGRKYWFDLSFWNKCPIVGHGNGENVPYWNVDGVKISTSIINRQPMKAEGLDGLCRFYRETNRIDPKWIIPPLNTDTTFVSHDVYWPILGKLPNFYSMSEDGCKLTPGGAYCVVSMMATANVELVSNDSVRISGTVADSKTGEPLPIAFVYAVDTNAAKEYLIKSTVAETDHDGNYSFTLERKDGQRFILRALGYAELLLELRCCIGCTQEHRHPSSFIEYH